MQGLVGGWQTFRPESRGCWSLTWSLLLLRGRPLLSMTPMLGKLTRPQVPDCVPAPDGMNGAEEQMCFRLFYWKQKDISSVGFGGMGKLFRDAPCNYSQGRSNLRSAENHGTTLVSKNTALFPREGVLTWHGLTAGAAGFLPGTTCHTWRIWMVQPDLESISLVTKLPELAL